MHGQLHIVFINSTNIATDTVSLTTDRHLIKTWTRYRDLHYAYRAYRTLPAHSDKGTVIKLSKYSLTVFDVN